MVLLATLAALVAASLGRPRISLSSSGNGVFHVEVKGLGSKLTHVVVTSAHRPLAWTRHSSEIVPTSLVAPGQSVRVSAAAEPPAWLRWLLGGSARADLAVRAPRNPIAAPIAVSGQPGSVPVTFGEAVATVRYRRGRGPTQTVHYRTPTTVARLPVPPAAMAGRLEVAAGAWTWERLASPTRTVTWFVAPAGGAPVAFAVPGPATATARPDAPIRLTFALPVVRALGHARPSITPARPGRWSEQGPNTLVFSPSGLGWGPGTTVSVRFDRPVTVVGANGHSGPANTAAPAHGGYRFTTAPASLTRLDQVLAQLHYLPLRFVPAPGVRPPTSFAAEVATMTTPLPGRLVWAWKSMPAALKAQWSVGSPNMVLKGALMAFDGTRPNYDGYAVDPLTVAQLANVPTWDALLHAAAGGVVDPHPYSYVYVTKSLPERLVLWKDGRVVLTAAVNTGIPVDPTVNGTFPVYLRYTFNYMSGHNPDGSYYHDPVYWINYFNGGDAVHGFVRASYGYPQSLGCVELPIATAHLVFDDLAIGDLVTVSD